MIVVQGQHANLAAGHHSGHHGMAWHGMDSRGTDFPMQQSIGFFLRCCGSAGEQRGGGGDGGWRWDMGYGSCSARAARCVCLLCPLWSALLAGPARRECE